MCTKVLLANYVDGILKLGILGDTMLNNKIGVNCLR